MKVILIKICLFVFVMYSTHAFAGIGTPEDLRSNPSIR